LNSADKEIPNQKKHKPNQRFGPEKRVKKRTEFLDIQSSGKKFKTANFLFICKEAEKSRIGITITTKIHKRAVRRNRVKRCIREVYRKMFGFLDGTFDLVVISHQGSIDLTYLEIKKEFNYALRKMCMVKKQ
jgi:ribonuclease P protein component